MLFAVFSFAGFSSRVLVCLLNSPSFILLWSKKQKDKILILILHMKASFCHGEVLES